jgi:hypothetical protein
LPDNRCAKFRSVNSTGPGSWTAPLDGRLSATDLAGIGADVKFLADVQADAEQDLADVAAEKIADHFGCLASFVNSFNSTARDDAGVMASDLHATESLRQALASPTGTTSAEFVGYLDLAAKSQVSKLKNLGDALQKLLGGGGGGCDDPVLQQEVQIVIVRVEFDINIIQSAENDISLVPRAGYGVIGNQTGGADVLIDPNLFPLQTTQFPPGVGATDQINVPELPPLTLNSGALNITSASPSSPTSPSEVDPGSRDSVVTGDAETLNDDGDPDPSAWAVKPDGRGRDVRDRMFST